MAPEAQSEVSLYLGLASQDAVIISFAFYMEVMGTGCLCGLLLREREAHVSAQSRLSSSPCTAGHGIGASLSELRGHRCMEREVLRATS